MAQVLYALDPTACGPGTLRIGDPTICPGPPHPPVPGLIPTFAGPQEHVYYDEADQYSYTDKEGIDHIGPLEEAQAAAQRIYATVSTAPVFAVMLTAHVESVMLTAPISAEVSTDE